MCVSAVREEDFSRITDLLKASNNTTSLNDQELRDLLRDEEAQQQNGFYNDNLHDRRAFFQTPQKQLFNARAGGILKTPGTANNRPKNVSFAPGNTQFSNPLYSSSLENSVLNPQPPLQSQKEEEKERLRPPVTPLKPNESTFRGLPGRFPKSTSEAHKINDDDDPFVSTKNILDDASFLDKDDRLEHQYDFGYVADPNNTGFKFNRFQKRPATPSSKPGPTRQQADSVVTDEKTQLLLQTITDQLLENNKNLAHLKQNSSTQKQEFLLQNIELREQVAECARLLKEALEERQNAVDYAYEKDQECLALKAQLAQERRKNIRLMEVVMQTQGTSAMTTNENYDFTRRRPYNFSTTNTNDNANAPETNILGSNRLFNKFTRGEPSNSSKQPAYTFKRSTRPASAMPDLVSQPNTIQNHYANSNKIESQNTRPNSLFGQPRTTNSGGGDVYSYRQTNRDRFSAYQPRGAGTNAEGRSRGTAAFDRDQVYSILKTLRRQAYELQLRYGDSKSMTTITDALDRAPSSRYQADYASLAATLQQQLILLQLPDTPQVAGFIAKIRELLNMIS